MNIEETKEVLINDVLPVFGTGRTAEAVENAIDILMRLQWYRCDEPPLSEEYVVYDGDEASYLVVLINSSIYGLCFGFYNEEAGVWFDYKTRLPFTVQPLETDLWCQFLFD